MNKLATWFIYSKNLVRLSLIKVINKGKVTFSPKQLLGKYSSIEIEGTGNLSIGEKLYTQSNFYLKVVNGECYIGRHCFFNHNCSITCLKKISIGDRCTFGNNVVIVDHDHNIHGDGQEFISKPIAIRDDVWIGANVVILKGVTIGKGSVVSAGTVVNKSIPDNVIFYGDYEHMRKK